VGREASDFGLRETIGGDSLGTVRWRPRHSSPDKLICERKLGRRGAVVTIPRDIGIDGIVTVDRAGEPVRFTPKPDHRWLALRVGIVKGVRPTDID